MQLTSSDDQMSCFNFSAWFGTYENGGARGSDEERRAAAAKIERVLVKARSLAADKQAAVDALRADLTAHARALGQLVQAGQAGSKRSLALQRQIGALKASMQRAQLAASQTAQQVDLLHRRHELLTQSSMRGELLDALDQTNSYVALGDAQYSVDQTDNILRDAGEAHVVAIEREQEVDSAFGTALNEAVGAEQLRFGQMTELQSGQDSMLNVGDAEALLDSLGDLLGDDFVAPPKTAASSARARDSDDLPTHQSAQFTNKMGPLDMPAAPATPPGGSSGRLAYRPLLVEEW